MTLWLAWVVQQLMPDEEGRSQSATCVPRCRLDPDVFKGTFAQDLAVTDTVEGDATGQHQIVQARLSVQVSCHSQHDLFANDLNRGGEVHLSLRDLRFGGSWGATEQPMEFGRCHRQPLAVIEVAHVHTK